MTDNEMTINLLKTKRVDWYKIVDENLKYQSDEPIEWQVSFDFPKEEKRL